MADARGAGRRRARSRVFVEAAAATTDDALAERAAARGAGAAPGGSPAARGAGRAGSRAPGRTTRRSRSPRPASPRRPTTSPRWAALRESYAGRGALERRPARRGGRGARSARPPPLEARVALALGAEDRDALAALAAEPTSPPRPIASPPGGEGQGEGLRRLGRDAAPALAAFVAGQPASRTSCASGASRPAPPRATSWRAPTPPPPAGQLAGLLTWTHELFADRAAAGGPGRRRRSRGRGARSPAAGRGDGRVQRGQVVVRERALRRGGRAHRRHADDRDRQRAPLRRRAGRARRRATTADARRCPRRTSRAS